jgi:hypothetical protein
MVTITSEEYDQLLKDSRWLRALEAAGVDNWEGYDIAVDYFDEWNKES